MNLPAALLSRFDLKFLLLDHIDHNNDLALAKHVLEVHRGADKEKKGAGDVLSRTDQFV